jgi:hypothetical protein
VLTAKTVAVVTSGNNSFTKRCAIDANCHASSSKRFPRKHAQTAAPPSSTPYTAEGDMKHVSAREGFGGEEG